MPTPFSTLRILPEVTSGRRFGETTLGYDRVAELRREHAILIHAVARIMGVDADQLTHEQVQRFTANWRGSDQPST